MKRAANKASGGGGRAALKAELKTLLPAAGGMGALLLLAWVWASQIGREEAASRPQRNESQERKSLFSELPSAAVKYLPALQEALAEKDPESRQELLKQWAGSVDPGSMEATLEEIGEEIEDPGLRSEAHAVLLSLWVERDLAAVAAWFGGRPSADALHQEARDQLVRAFARREPSEIVSWMEQSLPEPVRRELYSPFFRQWARQDPAAAEGQLQQLSRYSPGEAMFWNDLAAQVAGQWANRDLDSAVAWVQTLPEGQAKSQALVQISYRWAAADPRAAAAYAAREKDPVALEVVAGKWAESDPQSALGWLEALPADERRDRAVTQAATVWAQKDPHAAAKGIGQIPEGAFRERAAERLAGAWAEADASAAAQWLGNLPNTRSRDAAVGAFCGAIAEAHPERAFAWARTISSESLRHESLRQAGISWLEKDPQAARRAIAQSNIPPPLKNQMLEGRGETN
jgi:hypothetical protein